MSEKQYWYIATLVIAIKVEDVGDDVDPTCEEQIRAIRAPNAEAAYEKALQIGKSEETAYLNMYGQTVTWTFVGLDDLDELDNRMHDGVEIRSRLFGHLTPTSLVRAKADLSVFAAESNPDGRGYRIKTENIPAGDE
ncbi:MAG: DUF4288 domain-containing protein [Anaerolineae bacterium]|nr:DUF4288 domain-containing protein [Anaerolineae bacterium]